jgi:DNA polymerase III alpha subunit (gram-positive type)
MKEKRIYDQTLSQKYERILVLDVETTGLDSVDDRIIEFGGVLIGKTFYGRFRNILDERDIFIKQSAKLKDEIVNLTGITDQLLLERGQDESVLAKFFESVFAKQTDLLVTGYNIGFDMCFITQLMRRNGFPGWKFEGDMIDVMTVYRDHYHFVNTKMPGSDKKYGHSLSAAVEKLKIPVINTHRSIDDARATWEVFKKLFIIYADFRPYINRFGYNPKFGPAYAPLDPKRPTYERFDKIEYVPQDSSGDGKELVNSYTPKQ